MVISKEQLIYIVGCAGPTAERYLLPINQALSGYAINTPERIAAFLAQVSHESGQLLHTRELGSDNYLAKYDIGSLAERLGNTPEADGDGQKYRGRGLIQITGLYNYRSCSLGLFQDQRLLSHPDLLEQPEWAAQSAAWYWSVHGLNKLADQKDFIGITQKINGGLNGQAQRLSFWTRARAVLCQSSE